MHPTVQKKHGCFHSILTLVLSWFSLFGFLFYECCMVKLMGEGEQERKGYTNIGSLVFTPNPSKDGSATKVHLVFPSSLLVLFQCFFLSLPLSPNTSHYLSPVFERLDFFPHGHLDLIWISLMAIPMCSFLSLGKLHCRFYLHLWGLLGISRDKGKEMNLLSGYINWNY